MKENELKLLKQLLKKCLNEAKKGQGSVSPNPLVGAIVLDKENNFVSIGYHQKYGEAHAEVNAIKQAGNKTIGGTIIVNLEPCSHYGKTPPCVDLIIKSSFKRVVVGMLDPNNLVNGQGIKKLQEAGIDVIYPLLEEECKNLNEIFIKNQTQQKSFIAIKTATTLDGKIATSNNSSKWITSKKSRQEVQRLRNKYDAILTTSDTVISDNPNLTCRMKKGRNPIRIIVDTNFKTDLSANVYKNNNTSVFLAISEKTTTEIEKKIQQLPPFVKIIKCPLKEDKIDLDYLFNKLYSLKIMSILIEAGGKLNGAIISQKLCDKIYQFIAPKITCDQNSKSFAYGLNLSDINLSSQFKIKNIKNFRPDLLIESYPV